MKTTANVRAGVCRICGCVDEIGCADGCVWIKADLCSACVDVDELAPAVRSVLAELAWANARLTAVVGARKATRGVLSNENGTRRWISSSTMRALEEGALLTPHRTTRQRVRRELSVKGLALAERLGEIKTERPERLRLARELGR